MTQLRRDVVFVHIPKTAGTSLRAAMEKVLTTHLNLRDYGLEPETTPELRKLVYERNALTMFRQHFGSSRGIFLCGHFPPVKGMPTLPKGAARYWNYFNAESFITILRDPVKRVFSEYAHLVRHQGWRASFEEFLKTPNRCRKLCEALAGVDHSAFGFIGFMEDLDATVAGLGKFIGVELKIEKLNVGSYQSMALDLLADQAKARLVEAYCEEDIALYQRLRAERAGVFTAGSTHTEASYKGKVRLGSDQAATGWLCDTSRECIAEVEVLRDGKPFANVRADRYREHIKDEGLSRSGMCGFRVDLAGPLAKRAGALFTFRARDSQYELQGSPLRI